MNMVPHLLLYVLLVAITCQLTTSSVTITPIVEPSSVDHADSQTSNNVQHYRYTSKDLVTWQQAKSTCAHHRMSLPAPRSSDQLDRLARLIETESLNHEAGAVYLGASATHKCHTMKVTTGEKNVTGCYWKKVYACTDAVFFLHSRCPTLDPHKTWQEAKSSCLLEGSSLSSRQHLYPDTCKWWFRGYTFWTDDPEDYHTYWVDGTTAQLESMDYTEPNILPSLDNNYIYIDLSDIRDVMHVMITGDKKWFLVSDKARTREFVCQKEGSPYIQTTAIDEEYITYSETVTDIYDTSTTTKHHEQTTTTTPFLQVLLYSLKGAVIGALVLCLVAVSYVTLSCGLIRMLKVRKSRSMKNFDLENEYKETIHYPWYESCDKSCHASAYITPAAPTGAADEKERSPVPLDEETYV